MNEPGNASQHDLVVQRLRSLRQSMSGIEAPPAVERRVIAAFRNGSSARAPHRRVWWFTFAAAVGALAAALLTFNVPTPPPPPAVATVIEPPALTVSRQPAVKPTQATEVRRARRVAKRPEPRLAAPREEIATAFMEMPYAPPLLPGEGGAVVRVRMPRSAMREFGLPVTEERMAERVPADVLLGEDGVARAIRFVKVAQ